MASVDLKIGDKAWESYYGFAYNGKRCTDNVEPREIIYRGYRRSQIHNTESEAREYYSKRLYDHLKHLVNDASSAVALPDALIKRLRKFTPDSKREKLEEILKKLDDIETTLDNLLDD